MKPMISPLARTSLLALMIGLGPVAIGQTGGYRTDTGNQRGSANTTTDANYQNTQDQNRADMQQDRHDSKPGKRLGEFMGKDVHNRQGEKLGTIDDVVIDIRSGEATHVIVEHGGVLGIGRRSRAVPLGALDYQHTANDGDKRLVLDIDSARWSEAPAFERDRLDNLSDRDQRDRLNQFYGYDDTQARQGASLTSSTRDRDGDMSGNMSGDRQAGVNQNNNRDNIHRTTPGMNPDDRGQTDQISETNQTGQRARTGSSDVRSDANETYANQNRTNTSGSTTGATTGDWQNQNRELALASDIKGKTLRNGNQEVGSIDDIVIHMDRQKATALVEPSDDMVEGDDKFLVPFSRIDRAGDERLTTTLTRQDFERARTGTATPATGADRNLDRIERWSDDNRVIGMTKSD